MQKKFLIIIGIIILLAIVLGGLLFYKGYMYAEKVSQQVNLCEKAYQEKVKTHPDVFSTFDYNDRVSCYANIAIKENYLAICDRVDDKSSPYTLDCYVKFAIAKNDLSVCKKLNDVQGCEKNIKVDAEYLNKNNIYINPVKYGDIQIISPKAGEILDQNKDYKITWATDSFLDKDIIHQLTINEYGGPNGFYATFKPIPAKQGYYDFNPSSIAGLKLELGKKYYIRLNAGSAESFESTLVGVSDLFEFK